MSNQSLQQMAALLTEVTAAFDRPFRGLASYLDLAQERIESWERFHRPASASEE